MYRDGCGMVLTKITFFLLSFSLLVSLSLLPGITKDSCGRLLLETNSKSSGIKNFLPLYIYIVIC